ncbi:virion morphogenesis protein [Formicincola oecophyllae]|uniref:Virion morphogenesis protein n=1 Tax=Formicincola oecophyllae TaxID=2558361 RepID=A0A4Y6U9B0_9PROT|nr:phage virion morphogenesis protein [Formicincola oecophyllae]QDH14053.1 virion morphogenesis protein [Formicincola oecophyllae]
MAQITLSGDTKHIKQALQRLADIGRKPQPFLAALRTEVVDNTRQRLNEGRPAVGASYVAFNKLYAQSRKPLPPLIQGGGLQRSLTSQARGGTLIWGSNLVYAAAQQFGALIKPRTKPALTFRRCSRWGAAV